MSLRSALLGLLSAEPMSGYDLNRILDETFGYVWTAPHSQIYPTLRQMEREGLIEAEVQRTGERERRVYRVLDAGHAHLRQWAAEPVVYTGERDAAHLKASMMHLLSLDECEALFRDHLNYFRQRLTIWETRIEAIESGRSPILRARLEITAPEDHAKLIAFKLCSYEGSVMRAKAEIEWAERGLATVASLRSAGTSPPVETATTRSGGAKASTAGISAPGR
jgi:PadR family transcriptional regulator, regulator of vanillate utilization